MIYVLNGRCIQTLEGEDIFLDQSDIFILAPNIQHGIKVFDDNSLIINVLIRISTFLDIFMNYIKAKSQLSHFFLDHIYAKKTMKYIVFKTKNDQKIENYILDMYQESLRNDDFSDNILISTLSIFFSTLTRNYTPITPSPHSNTVDERFINYIYKNYSSVTLASLARHFNYSTPYCSKIIKEMFGYTFSELLTKIRMQQAENLLAHTQMSIFDICDTIGYKNPETLIRVFQKNYGLTPSQYRKKNNRT